LGSAALVRHEDDLGIAAAVGPPKPHVTRCPIEIPGGPELAGVEPLGGVAGAVEVQLGRGWLIWSEVSGVKVAVHCSSMLRRAVTSAS
jgi:hypothetical protein